MGWRGTVILGGALLASGIYLYRDVTAEHPDATWQTLFEESRPPPPGAQIKRLLDFDPATATRIRLRRDDRQWMVERPTTSAPWQGAERPGDVQDFIQALQDLAEILPLDVPPEALADHGLDPPEMTVEVERSGGPPLVLLVGHRNPPATGVYVQLGRGGPVVLTGALLLWEFDKATRAFAATG